MIKKSGCRRQRNERKEGAEGEKYTHDREREVRGRTNILLEVRQLNKG